MPAKKAAAGTPAASSQPQPLARQEVRQLRGELEDLLQGIEADDAAPSPAPGVVDAAIFDSGDHDRESLAREALRRALAQEQDAHRHRTGVNHIARDLAMNRVAASPGRPTTRLRAD